MEISRKESECKLWAIRLHLKVDRMKDESTRSFVLSTKPSWLCTISGSEEGKLRKPSCTKPSWLCTLKVGLRIFLCVSVWLGSSHSSCGVHPSCVRVLTWSLRRGKRKKPLLFGVSTPKDCLSYLCLTYQVKTLDLESRHTVWSCHDSLSGIITRRGEKRSFLPSGNYAVVVPRYSHATM